MRHAKKQRGEPATLADNLLQAPLTTNRLAQLISYHPESVRRAVRDGRIKARKFGRTWRVPAEEVSRIVREGLPV